MRRHASRFVARLTLLALCTAFGMHAPAQPRPAADVPRDPAMLGRVEAILREFDADGNRSMDEPELQAAAAAVAERHGAGGTAILNRHVSAADTDGDGRLTEEEWQGLREKVRAAGPVVETVMLPMRDGTELCTRIWRPAGPGAFPVILSRTPYNSASDNIPNEVRSGYAVVRQDMRGRFKSKGENLPFIACGWGENRDGEDTVRWLAAQPWCNGKIGTFGGSALGITQNLLAGCAPEALTCQYIAVAAASLYHHAAYVGGALRLSQIERWLKENRFAPEAEQMYRDHPVYDEFWAQFDSMSKHDVMNVPALHMGGWFDTFSAGTVASFRGRRHDGAESARGDQKLVMGPWAHGGFRDGGKIGDMRFPDAQMPNRYGPGGWFEHYLKGVDNGIDAIPAVAYYVMGNTDRPDSPGNEWRFAEDWPIPCETVPLFLSADGTLGTQLGANPGRVAIDFDPENPCPTKGGCNLTLPAGPMDQREIERRPDVAVFSTEPLDEPLEITGHIRAEIRLAASTVDTDVSVRFCDVYPDGRSFLMAEGMLRARFREGLDREIPLRPGIPAAVNVELWPTSVVIDRGHRIRIAITASNYPRFDVNPGTGIPDAPGGKRLPQRNEILCGDAEGSRVLLPVIR